MNNPKPFTARQTRKFLRKPLDKCSEQELNDRYKALWDLIQEKPGDIKCVMWLDEQAKVSTLLKAFDAKKPVDYGNDQPSNTQG